MFRQLVVATALLWLVLGLLTGASPPQAPFPHGDPRWLADRPANGYMPGPPYGEQLGYPDNRAPFYGDASRQVCPWPPRNEPQPPYVQPAQHAPPQGIGYAQQQYPAGSAPQQLNRVEQHQPLCDPRLGPYNQAPAHGWQNMTAGPSAQHGSMAHLTVPQPASSAPVGHQRERDAVPPAPRRHVTTRNNGTSPAAPRSHAREQRDVSRRTAATLSQRRERVRDTVGRSSEYRSNLRASSPRVEQENRAGRSIRSAAGGPHQ